MESNSADRGFGRPDATTARDALDALASDREDIASRFTEQTRWAAPAQGAGVAVLIAAPAAGLPWMAVLSTVAIAILVGVERRFRARTGLSISRPAGPLGMVLLVATILVMVAGVAVSLVLSLAGEPRWVVLVVALGFVLTTSIVVAYDRVYAREVRRVR